MPIQAVTLKPRYLPLLVISGVHCPANDREADMPYFCFMATDIFPVTRPVLLSSWP